MTTTYNNNNTIDIYIPRILGYVSKKYIIETFHNMNIGYASKLSLFYRKNSSNKEYFFAFITMQLYKTTEATKFTDRLNANDKFQFNYDEESNHYWDIQLYIPINERLNTPKISSPNKTQMPDQNVIVNQTLDQPSTKPNKCNAPPLSNVSNTLHMIHHNCQVHKQDPPIQSRLNTYLQPLKPIINNHIYNVFSDFSNIFGNPPFTEKDQRNFMNDYDDMNRQIYDNIGLDCIV